MEIPRTSATRAPGGRLYLCTPGHGLQWARWEWGRLASVMGVPHCISSFETRPCPGLRYAWQLPRTGSSLVSSGPSKQKTEGPLPRGEAAELAGRRVTGPQRATPWRRPTCPLPPSLPSGRMGSVTGHTDVPLLSPPPLKGHFSVKTRNQGKSETEHYLSKQF